MFMDFDRELVEGRGYGTYERLPTANLPFLWLAYLSDPSNSGKIHSVRDAGLSNAPPPFY